MCTTLCNYKVKICFILNINNVRVASVSLRVATLLIYDQAATFVPILKVY
jgi:hypothetical protein